MFNDILVPGVASPPTGAVAGQFDIFEVATGYGYDPDDSASLACDSTLAHGGQNVGSYCNPQADTLFQQELATPDAGLRQNIFNQLHVIYVTDLPFITLFSPLLVTVVRNGTHNYQPSW